jgi:deoxyribonuclease V
MWRGDYNQAVKVKNLHDWQVTTAQAEVIQRRLATLVSTKSKIASPQLIAGVDISPPNAQGIATGAIVVLSYPQFRVVEIGMAKQRLDFPYVPGLLSFRESPLILTACQKLTMSPDLILVDGQGLAHPRRLGLASHLGLLLDVATIGCAKSRLCGAHDSVGETPGSFAELRDDGEVIGAVLRTRERANPLYISIGHKIDLETTIFWVMECCCGYRIPEPTRLAHLAAAGRLESKEAEVEQGRLFL